MGLKPSLIGCYIWEPNHSFERIRRSRQCVFNIPTVDLAKKVVGIGNTTGRDIDKFAHFRLTTAPASTIDAPLIEECHAGFECHLYDGSQIRKHGLFIFEVVKAHARRSPKFPKTIHYRGDGLFMISGPTVSRWRKGFKAGRM